MKKADEILGNEETAKRRDAALLRALSTPRKRQAEMKIGKPKPESGSDASRKKCGRLPKHSQSSE